MSNELRALVDRANQRGGDPSLRAIVDKANSRGGNGGGLVDAAKSFGSGLVRGVAGLPDVIGLSTRPTTYAIEKIGEAVTGEVPRIAGKTPGQLADQYLPFGGGNKGANAGRAIAPGAMDYEPETTAGKFAQTAGEFIPGAAAGGVAMSANVPASIARFGIAPGVASEAAGQATEGTGWEAPARLAAAVAAGSPRAVGTIPRKVADGIDDSVRFLERAGVRLSAGQRADDVALKGREQATAAGKGLQDQALDDFTKAVLTRIRGQGDRWDRGNLEATGARIGQMFDDVAKRTTIQADETLAAGVRGAIDDVDSAPKSLRDIADQIEDLATRPGGAVIDGATYQRWASIAGKASKSGNPNTREAAIAIRGALDDALQRYASGSDVNQLATARQLYRDLLIVERAATSAGATGGKIPPAALRTAAKAVLGNRAYVGARSEMSELARHGANIMPGPYGPEAAMRNQGVVDTMIGAGAGASLGGLVGMPGVGGAIGAVPYMDLGHTKFDLHRSLRNGFPEVVYGEGKTPEQVGEIFERMGDDVNILATRVSAEMAGYVLSRCPDANYNDLGRTLSLTRTPINYREGEVAIVTAGTSDLNVAEEARSTCEVLGSHAFIISDVGVAGIHRLLDRLDQIRTARVIIVIAGMEGALASVIGGLVSQPIVAVPTSVGYGAAFSGVAALLGMLTSCASGVTVVNIDNGFGAACAACKINNL